MTGRLPVVCLMGPTASGKTEIAIELSRRFPLDIVSVDSAMVYRGMDIGTAKPEPAVLRDAPHRLVDIVDPEETYSAGTFVRDARREIDSIHALDRVPLLAGGTMLYFRSLIEGIAQLPDANPEIRSDIDSEAERKGWPALHAELASIDPQSAARIKPNDRQRIQRSLEVFRITGRRLSDCQANDARKPPPFRFIKLALGIRDRADLHTRINARFQIMLDSGFLQEVAGLKARPGLTAGHSAMRAVGYRQLWAHLDGEQSLDEASIRAQAATRQLAKRQLTWLRSDAELKTFNPLEAGSVDAISEWLGRVLNE